MAKLAIIIFAIFMGAGFIHETIEAQSFGPHTKDYLMSGLAVIVAYAIANTAR